MHNPHNEAVRILCRHGFHEVDAVNFVAAIVQATLDCHIKKCPRCCSPFTSVLLRDSGKDVCRHCGYTPGGDRG